MVAQQKTAVAASILQVRIKFGHELFEKKSETFRGGWPLRPSARFKGQ